MYIVEGSVRSRSNVESALVADQNLRGVATLAVVVWEQSIHQAVQSTRSLTSVADGAATLHTLSVEYDSVSSLLIALFRAEETESEFHKNVINKQMYIVEGSVRCRNNLEYAS
jgi:hypothetical protein